MITRFVAASLSALMLCSAASAAPSGPWAKYNGRMKADALFRDASGGYLDEVKSIVQGGGDLNWQREDGRTPLMSAAAAGHADIVEFMLKNGADPALRDNNGKTALDAARSAGAMDVARVLERTMQAPVRAAQAAPTAAGAGPAPAAPSGPWAKYNGKFKADALFRDADGGYLDSVRSIVQGGADVNWQREDGRTPLMSAAEAGHADIVAFLLQQGADPTLRDARGKTAFDLARSAGAMDVAKMLQGAANGAALAPARPVAQAPQAPAPKPAPPRAAPEPAPPQAAPAPVPNAAAPVAGSTRWAPFGTYAPGQRVQYYLPTGWRTGTVRTVGSSGGTARTLTYKEKRYEIASDKFPNNPDWSDWGTVAGVDRAPFWTSFFIGDWATGEVMAVNTRIEGRYEISEYSYHAATEGLRINADGSYRWKPMGTAEIRGKWQAASDGPGVVLLKGYNGANWTLRNETNATDEYIRGIETARLYPDNTQMSIAAKRPLAGGRKLP